MGCAIDFMERHQAQPRDHVYVQEIYNWRELSKEAVQKGLPPFVSARPSDC